jgi:hypothetical protein
MMSIGVASGSVVSVGADYRTLPTAREPRVLLLPVCQICARELQTRMDARTIAIQASMSC